MFKLVQTVWSKDKILGFISKGEKYYHIYLGNPFTAKRKDLNELNYSVYLDNASNYLLKFIKERKIPFTLKTHISKENCKLEHFYSNGNAKESYLLCDALFE